MNAARVSSLLELSSLLMNSGESIRWVFSPRSLRSKCPKSKCGRLASRLASPMPCNSDNKVELKLISISRCQISVAVVGSSGRRRG